MKKRKYIGFILFALVLIVIMVYLFFPRLYIKMVSENVKKLERAVVTVKDATDEQNLCVIEIEEKAQLNELYDTIKNTAEIQINRYPRHSVVTGADSEYEIQLFYSNGKVDKLGTTEDPHTVYRMLENDDNGYIAGKNDELPEYVLYLAKTQGDGSAVLG